MPVDCVFVRSWFLCVVVLIVVWSAAGAVPVHGQDSIDLVPVRDNTLYEDAAGGVSNGAGDHLFAGRNNLGANRRALLAFDVAAVPAGARVDSVALRLNASNATAGTHAVALHRVLADWGEGTSNATGAEGQGTAATSGDATWLHARFDAVRWQTPGGDYVATPSATRDVAGTGAYTWHSTPALLADVQAWRDDPSTNHGWILIGNEATQQTAKRFDSRENGSAAARPVLTVYYSTGTAAERDDVPVRARLLPAYPNPFATATTIAYELDDAQPVRLDVFDLLGRRVTVLVDGWQAAGAHHVRLEGGALVGGTYVYRLQAGGTRLYGRVTRSR